MLEVTLSNVKELDLHYLIGVVPNKKDKKPFITLVDAKFILSNGESIIIPKGFKFDGSSRPKFLGCFLEKFGAFLIGALIHDWIYVMDLFDQKFGDNEMLIWSTICNSEQFSDIMDNWIRFMGVRLFGKPVYKK